MKTATKIIFLLLLLGVAAAARRRDPLSEAEADQLREVSGAAAVDPDAPIQHIADVDSLDLMEFLYGFQTRYPHIPADESLFKDIDDTTTMRVVTGLIPLLSGSIRYNREDISHMPAHERVTAGICLSPEGRQVFPDLTVMENLSLGSFNRRARPNGRRRRPGARWSSAGFAPA